MSLPPMHNFIDVNVRDGNTRPWTTVRYAMPNAETAEIWRDLASAALKSRCAKVDIACGEADPAAQTLQELGKRVLADIGGRKENLDDCGAHEEDPFAYDAKIAPEVEVLDQLYATVTQRMASDAAAAAAAS